MPIETPAPPKNPPDVPQEQGISDASDSSNNDNLFEEIAQGFDSFKETVSDFTQSVRENPFVRDMLDGFSLAWSSATAEYSMLEGMENLYGAGAEGQQRYEAFQKSYEEMRSSLLERPDGVEQLQAVNNALTLIAAADPSGLTGSDGKPIFDNEGLTKIAESLVFNVTEPAAEDNQGRTLGCFPMSQFVSLAELNPGRYAGIIADLATKGKFIDADDNEVTPDRDSLRLGADALVVTGSTHDSGVINAASHLWQLGFGQMSADVTPTALSDYLEVLSDGQLTPEFIAAHPELQYVYKRVPPEHKRDTGERIGFTYSETDAAGNVTQQFEEFSLGGKPLRSPMSIPQAIAEMNRRMFGETLGNDLLVLDSSNYSPGFDIDGVNETSTERQLASGLQDKLDQGILPQVMVWKPGSSIPHAVSVLSMRVDPKTGDTMVATSDHFGNTGMEGEMLLSDLYALMLRPR